MTKMAWLMDLYFIAKKKKKGGDIEIELKPGYASQPKTASQ